MASNPMIGRKTNGGFVITSNPPRPEFVVRTTGDGLSLGLEEGESLGVGDGDAGAEGVGVGEPCSVK